MNISIKPPTTAVVRAVQRYEAARAEVAPYIGEPGFAFDSAGAVYKHALKQLGHDVSGINNDVAEVCWNALKNHKPVQARAMATDAKAVTRRNEMFPNANRLKSGYY